jgi:hypothetical protein
VRCSREMRQSAPKCRFNAPKLDTFWTPAFRLPVEVGIGTRESPPRIESGRALHRRAGETDPALSHNPPAMDQLAEIFWTARRAALRSAVPALMP